MTVQFELLVSMSSIRNGGNMTFLVQKIALKRVMKFAWFFC